MDMDEKENSKLGMSQRYRLKKKLKEGAFGSLLLACDKRSETDVLVKVASPWISRDQAFKAYVYDRWAEKETLFEHPNIAGVIDVGKSKGRYFIVTEYPGDYTLADELNSAPIQVEKSIELLRQTSEALRAAHRRNIASGHLKPSDIYITTAADGQPTVKVMLVDMDVEVRNAAGSILGESYGIPKYMAPEVIKGRRPSPQSDIFALGVLAYEMVTGEPPFDSEHPLGYFHANCNETPTPPHKIKKGLPDELSMTIIKCLEKDTSRRYRSMQHLIDDLDRCMAIIQTGTTDFVPRGIDSALVSDYAPADGIKETKSAGSNGSLSKIAFALALAVLIFTVGIRIPPLRDIIYPSDAPPAATYDKDEVTEPDPYTEPEQEPEIVFEEEYEKLVNKWEEDFLPSEAYQPAIDDFLALAQSTDESEHKDKAIDKAASIYAFWGDQLEQENNFNEAAEKYREATEIAPEGSEYENIYEKKMPQLLLAEVRESYADERFAEADEIAQKLLERFPDTEAASETKTLLPTVSLERAKQKREENETGQAIAMLRELVKEYSGSDEAEKAARELLPEYNLEMLRTNLDTGDREAAQQYKTELRERYPDTEYFAEAKSLWGELILEDFSNYFQQEDREAAKKKLDKLLANYRNTGYAYKAVRLWVGIERDPQEQIEAERAATLLSAARDATEGGNFVHAYGILERIVRRAPADFEKGIEALDLISECLFKKAMKDYGRGRKDDLPGTLKSIAENFVFTKWEEAARMVLQQYEATPEGMAYVPASSFTMGADKEDIIGNLQPYYPESRLEDESQLNLILELEGYSSEMPKHTARTDAFYIDLTLVTKAEYKEFVEETGHREPETWSDIDISERGDFPVTYVTYSDAEAYARWAGKRLPTETEWEKAARGVDGRAFPWGRKFEEDKAHHLKSPRTGPIAVGEHPEGSSPFGALDMIGNVSEWTAGGFMPYEEDPMTDRRAQYGEEHRVVRGGAWIPEDSQGAPVTVTRRFPRDPEEPARHIGFRCVKDADSSE